MNELQLFLRRKRGSRRLREVAEASTLSIGMISDLERGRVDNLTKPTILKLALGLGTTPLAIAREWLK